MTGRTNRFRKSTVKKLQLRAHELRAGDKILSPASKRWTGITEVEPTPGGIKVHLPHYTFTKNPNSLIDIKQED